MKDNAEDGSRTHKVFLPHGPEPCASANSATSAYLTVASNVNNYSDYLRVCQELLKKFNTNLIAAFEDFYLLAYVDVSVMLSHLGF